MKRFKVLFGQRRFQVLVTMAVLLLAVSVIVASGANFTAQTANAGNVFTAGALTMTNDKDAGRDPHRWPAWCLADIDDGYVQLENTGDRGRRLLRSPRPKSPTSINLGGELHLTVSATDPCHPRGLRAPILRRHARRCMEPAFRSARGSPLAAHTYHFHGDLGPTRPVRTDDDRLDRAQDLPTLQLHLGRRQPLTLILS